MVKLETVLSPRGIALLARYVGEQGISGVTITETFDARHKVEIVAPDERLHPVWDTLLSLAPLRPITVTPVFDVISIRTGDRGGRVLGGSRRPPLAAESRWRVRQDDRTAV